GQIFVDHSTVGLETSRQCAARARERGADFLDAPVSGGPAGAQAATLTIMVGGERATFERALPVLQAYGAKENIRLCGATAARPPGRIVTDVGRMVAGPAKHGRPPVVRAGAGEEFERGSQAGSGDDDMAGLLRPYEQAAGVEVHAKV